MKTFVLFLLFFVLFDTNFASSNCADQDLKLIALCYREFYGDMSNPSWPSIVAEPLLVSVNRTREFWQPYCDVKKKLNDCIGSTRIKACFNIKDVERLSFVNTVGSPKFLISTFLQIDYTCDKLFKLSDSDYNCLMTVTPKLEKECVTCETETCEVRTIVFNCTIGVFNRECSKVAGCYMRKNIALLKCWTDIRWGCNTCNGISVTNNQIDGLCDDNNVEGNIIRNSFYERSLSP